jgi:hypothetical protein
MSTRRWITTLIGFWIVLSAFLGFGAQGYAWNDLLAGAVAFVAGAALIKEWAWEGWTVVILGAWMVIASFISGLHVGGGVYWNNLLVGVAVALIGLIPTRVGGAGRPHPAA